MVGQKFLEAFAASPEANAWDVTVFCEEPRPAYDRVHLTEFFSGSSAEDLSLIEAGFFDNSGFTVRLGDKAQAIDTNGKTVSSAQGDTLRYDRLVLATGSFLCASHTGP